MGKALLRIDMRKGDHQRVLHEVRRRLTSIAINLEMIGPKRFADHEYYCHGVTYAYRLIGECCPFLTDSGSLRQIPFHVIIEGIGHTSGYRPRQLRHKQVKQSDDKQTTQKIRPQ